MTEEEESKFVKEHYLYQLLQVQNEILQDRQIWDKYQIESLEKQLKSWMRCSTFQAIMGIVTAILVTWLRP